GSWSARRMRSSGSPPSWRRPPRPADDHGRPRRRPHRHPGHGRRADRARLVGRCGGSRGATRRPVRAPPDQQQGAPRRGRARLAAADAVEIRLAHVRGDGRRAIADALVGAYRRGRPAVVVPDAETAADLETIAAGLRDAEAEVPVLARCAPAFAAILTGTGAA